MSLLSAAVGWLLDVVALLRWIVGVGMLVSGLLVVPFGVALPVVWKRDVLGVQALYGRLRFLPGLSSDGTRRAIAAAFVYTLLGGYLLLVGGMAVYPADVSDPPELNSSGGPTAPAAEANALMSIDRPDVATPSRGEGNYLALSGADSTKTSTETNVPSISSPSALS